MKTNRDMVIETARMGMRHSLIDAQCAIQRAKVDMEQADLELIDRPVGCAVDMAQEHISNALRYLKEAAAPNALPTDAESMYDPGE